jgi:hypothetical protein
VSCSEPLLSTSGDRRTSSLETGLDSAECCLAIASDGTIFFAPAFSGPHSTVARSEDDGRSWILCEIELPGGRRHGRMQSFMYLDPLTQRIYYHTARMQFRALQFAGGFNLSYSDDYGRSWHHTTVAPGARDWGKLYSGPRPDHSGHVVYFSAPSPISTRAFPVLFPRSQRIYRSYDGGAAWEAATPISLKPREHGLDVREWVIFGNGIVDQSGVVHLGLRRGPHFAVATSRDEGNTWTIATIPDARLRRYRNILQVGLVNPNYVIPEPLTINGDVLHAFWPDEFDALRMSSSTDKGTTWSQAVVVSAPEIRRVRYSAATGGPDSALAIAYYGTTDGRTYHGYIAESRNPTEVTPVFTGGRINDPASPLYPHGWDTGYLGMFAGGDLNEIVQVRYAKDASIYAAFCRQVSPGWPTALRPRSHTTGVLGRLTAAEGEA